jgi:hypothetical protein
MAVILKPQDTLLLVKYWSLKKQGKARNVRDIAEAIGISPGEVSKGTQRLVASHLVVERSGDIFSETGAMLEWLSYGVRYAYPYESIGFGRGMATSWNCPVLKSEVVSPVPALVWQTVGGDTEGLLIKPLHQSVPLAASRDTLLYQVMSLVEAIRGGKPRELAIARELLTDLIKGK